MSIVERLREYAVRKGHRKHVTYMDAHGAANLIEQQAERIKELAQQRDELLAAQEGIKKAAYYDGYTEREREVRDAIQALEDAVSIFGPEPDQPCLAPKWYERATAATAKAKGD